MAQKKPDTEDSVLHSSIYVKFKKVTYSDTCQDNSYLLSGRGDRGWIVIGNGNGRVFWGAGNVLYFDLRNGYRGMHSSEDLVGCILKISALGSVS